MNYKHYRRTLEDSHDLEKDEIPGGLAEGKKPSDFPKLKIKQGKKVEMEHTSDPKVAEEIAMDHLTEDPKYYEKLKTIEKKPLQKMSRPRLNFPGLPKVSTRPDQDVQTLETKRQKDLYGRKVANAVVNDYANSKPGALKDKKPHLDMAAKRTAGKFDRTTLGLNHSTKDQSYSAAVAGKLRSKFEEGDEAYDQKMDAHKQKVTDTRNKYFEDIAEWKKQAESLPQGSNAYWEHVANRPKYKKPRKPSKSLKATKDLSPDQMKRRGNAVDSTIEHEGFHNIMDQVEREYGGRAAHIVKEKILGSHDKEALSHVASYIKNRLGYKPQSEHFEEEVLAHARDILVNPDKRKKFEEFVGSDKSRDIMNKLKTGHQRAYDFSQSVTPQSLEQEDMKQFPVPTKLAASEPLNKAPMEYTSTIMQEMPPKEPKKGNFSKIHEKVLPNGLIYKQYSKGDTSLHQIYHPQHEGPVAEVTTRAVGNPDPSAVQDHKVTWSQVHPEHKGKGFGKIAYKAALMHGKGVGRLMSDQLTSRQAESAWDHLQQQPGVKVKRGKWLASTPRYTKEQDEAINSQHSAIIPVKSVVDEKAMFPDVGVGKKKLAASEMEKGAARRLYGKFNPAKELGEEGSKDMVSWVGGNSMGRKVRGDLVDPSVGAKLRMTNKLSNRAASRLNPNTKQREFLLHRQMSEWEFDQHHKDGRMTHSDPDDFTSWTPFLDSITQSSGIYPRDTFDKQDNQNYNTIVSAWVPESHIKTMPIQYGRAGTSDAQKFGEPTNTARKEQEVIVRPGHNSQVHAIHKDTGESADQWTWKKIK